MTTVIKPTHVPIERMDGTVVHIPDVTILAWASAMKLEVKGLKTTKGRSLSAIIKENLGLPKRMSKANVFAVVTDLKNQLLQDVG